MTDEDSIDYQTEEWVAGRPWHNVVRDECCPDFSCCRPDMLWPKRMREFFTSADFDTQSRMMLTSLQGLVGDSAHVLDPDDTSEQRH